MTYHEDLSEYCSFEGITLSYVGWLDPMHPHEVGDCSVEFEENLEFHAGYSIKQYLGSHTCPYCESKRKGRNPKESVGGREVRLGTCDILVFNDSGTRGYLAPNMILHYVRTHSYRPPNDFVEAILGGPLPNSGKYIELLDVLDKKMRIGPLVQMHTWEACWLPEFMRSIMD